MKVGRITSVKSKMLLLVAVLLLFSIVAVAVVAGRKHESKTTTFDSVKAYSVMQPRNCKKAMPFLKTIIPNDRQMKESIAVLSYRSSCYFNDKKYSQALSDIQLERSYYVKLKDKPGVANLDEQISFIKQKKTASEDPSNKGSVRNEGVTPEFAKKLAEENQ
jgi:hypothetical protein